MERADRIGGKIESKNINGVATDCGPTVLTLRGVFEAVFRDAGSDLRSHIELTRLDKLARHFWFDGSSLDLFSDLDRTYQSISEFSSKKSAEQYLRFSKTAASVFETLTPSFLLRSEPDLLRLVTSKSIGRLIGLNPFDTLKKYLSQSFDDPRLVQLFSRYATYCGASPFLSPATLMLVAHVERLGVWTLAGGMMDLANALRKLAEKNGAEFRLNAEAERIEFIQNRVAHVRLASGEMTPSHAVICTADIAALANNCLGPTAARAVPARMRTTRSQSAITWTFAAACKGPALDHHNVFFSEHYEDEFTAIFDHDSVPRHPTVYICAPGSGEERSLFCLINAPANGDKRTYFEEEITTCYTRMTETLGKCGLSLSPNPQTVSVSTPTEYAKRFPATGGALYGPASHGWQAAFKRQGVRSRKRGLYLAGGSMHPGPGLPMAALSGRAAAHALLSDLDLITPQTLAAMRGGISMV